MFVGIVIFAINAVFTIIGIALSLNKNNKGLYIQTVFNFLTSIAMLIVQGKYKFAGGASGFLFVLNLLLSIGGLAAVVYRQIKQKGLCNG